MSRTETFFIHPKKGAARVKQGFSWPAFFLGSLWAAAKKMWVPEFLYMGAVDIILWFLTGYAEARDSEALALLGLVSLITYAVVRGKYGNKWLSSSLARWGYTPTQNRTEA